MRRGTFFSIPESPADIERLWKNAASLDSSTCPSWLPASQSYTYRLVELDRNGDGLTREQDGYARELDELAAAGVIVDEDSRRSRFPRSYIAAPLNWSIGIYTGDSPLVLRAPSDVKNPVLTRDDVSDVLATFVADPFMLHARDMWFMFFEVMNWRANKGEIGLATSADGLTWRYERIVLAEAFHLSYPYIFEWMNEYYMIPESYQAGGIRLYKATDFPTDWAYVGTLLNGPYLVDPSIVRHENAWWLFTETSRARRHDTLELYSSNELMGPWRPHPMNPIVAGNPSAARPAGRVIVDDGKVIRYAQSCVPEYGTEVRAFELTVLTASSYQERETDPVLLPTGTGWNAHGMHHVDPHRHADRHWVACVDGWTRC